MAYRPVHVSELQAGDVVLYRGNSLLGELIRLFDGTEVNHAGLYLGAAGHVTPMVGEALGNGLVKQSLLISYGDNERLLARRLVASVPTMVPVVQVAERYLTRGSRYGYEQIVLLALLGLTRKVRLTPLLGVLLREILDQAASAVTNAISHATGGDPMICSEFVYRCYADAVSGPHDAYELQIEGLQLGGPLRLEAERGVALADTSLLAFAQQDRSLVDYVNAAPSPRVGLAETVRLVPESRTLEELASDYFKEAESETDYGIAAQTVLAETRESLRGFAQAMHPARAEMSVEARGLTGVTPFAHLAAAADFVTPGDLLRTDSLVTRGEIRLSD